MGLLWTWWVTDELPLLPPLPGLHVEAPRESARIAPIIRTPKESIDRDFKSGNQVYLAYLHNNPIAYGWSACHDSMFGQPSVHFHVPAHNLYLHTFVTFSQWRGQGIYPRLLQAILQHHRQRSVERFWIIHQKENTASLRGIAKAGFHIAARVFRSPALGLHLVPYNNDARTWAGAELLGLPILTP